MFIEMCPTIKKASLTEKYEIQFDMSDGSSIKTGTINPGLPNNIISSGVNVRTIPHIESVSDLPDDADPGTLYIVMDTSDMYLNTGNRWDTIGTVSNDFEENKKNVPFCTCPKCGAPMKSFICEYCGSDFTYLR